MGWSRSVRSSGMVPSSRVRAAATSTAPSSRPASRYRRARSVKTSQEMRNALWLGVASRHGRSPRRSSAAKTRAVASFDKRDSRASCHDLFTGRPKNRASASRSGVLVSNLPRFSKAVVTTSRPLACAVATKHAKTCSSRVASSWEDLRTLVSTSARARSSSTRAGSVNSGSGSGSGPEGLRHRPETSASGLDSPQPSSSERASPAATESCPDAMKRTVSSSSGVGDPTRDNACSTSRRGCFSCRGSTATAMPASSPGVVPGWISASRTRVRTLGWTEGRAAIRRACSSQSCGARPSPTSQSRAPRCALRLSPRSRIWISALLTVASSNSPRSRSCATRARTSPALAPSAQKSVWNRNAFWAVQAIRNCSVHRTPGRGRKQYFSQSSR